VYGPRVWNSLPDELRSPDITLDYVQKQTEDVIIQRVAASLPHL